MKSFASVVAVVIPVFINGCALPVLAAETVRFEFQGPTSVKVGERFRVQLRIDPAGQDVAEVPFIIGYDPVQLEVQSVIPGPFLGSQSSEPTFNVEIDSGEGRIRVDAERRSAARPAPDVLATVVFRALRRFSSTPVQGLTMAPVSAEGEGLPPAYPDPLNLRQR